jgi:signal peptidase I
MVHHMQEPVKKKSRTGVLEIVGIVLIVLLVFLAVVFSVEAFKVDGTSMMPSVHNREYLLIDKVRYHFSSPERGQIIVFYEPQQLPDGKLVKGEKLIKRIIGLPGETLEIRGGEIYINGAKLEENPDFGPIPYFGNYSITIPADEYWVIGDNRANSLGSQNFGPVPRDFIVGRMWLSYWPLSQWGLSPHYSWHLERMAIVSLSVLREAGCVSGYIASSKHFVNCQHK